MTATDRIKEYLDYKGIPVYQAEKACGVSNASISKALKPGATTMKSDTLEKFLSTYTDLSAEWVLRGIGKMLIKHHMRKASDGKQRLTASKEETWPGLSAYWARHTWATIAASLDIPKETIAHALGHSQHSVTDIYIDFDRTKVDRANRKVLDWVLYSKC